MRTILKKISIFSLTVVISGFLAVIDPRVANADRSPDDFYALEGKLLDGSRKDFTDYRGKVVLITNIALQCGTTPQLKALQELDQEFGNRGLAILAFPSNDFTGEDMENTENLLSFCTDKYSITFPVFSPGRVIGANPQPVFAFLTQNSPGEFQGEVTFNFEKFLLNRKGKVIARFGSFTSAQSQILRSKLKELIEEKQ